MSPYGARAFCRHLDGYVLKNQSALDYLNSGHVTRVTPPAFTIEMSRK